MIGATLGRYRLDSLLGEGGMGKVYRAWDPTLGRAAALKLLPSGVLHDAERLERFTREARTASALNHPNVVTIYEIGADDGQHFIAMELVEGETLRQRLIRGRMELPRALDMLAQVADGVAAAHAAGIVHRDLKPENIVLAHNGFVKILDFGLAKLRVPAAVTPDSATAVMGTTPGMILGTIGYMAPEQARGEEVDHRGDIFALGCMLYEAVAGTRAFRGDSAVDTLHRIIYTEPPPLSEVVPDTPAEVQRIVRKCLAKDPEQRYQSAKDVAIDLRNAKREIESTPSVRVASNPRAPRRVPVVAIAAAILAVAALVTLLVMQRQKPAAVDKPPMSITRLTSTGNVIGAAISPNGEYLAYAYSEAARHSVWVRQIATGSELQIMPPSPGGVWGITFAPDSRSIYYGFKSTSDPSGALYQTPILGGPARRLLQRIDSHVHFSPDGKRMIFVRMHEPKPGHSAIIIANADGSNERMLLSKAPPQSLSLFWGAPDWSPDGKSLAVPVRDGIVWNLLIADVATGAQKHFSRDPWSTLGDVQWLSDGSGVLVVGGVTRAAAQIWFVSRDGTRERVTNDLLTYRVVSLTADDAQLVTVAADVSSSIWRVPLDGSREPSKLTNAKYDGLRGVAAAADGTIYFYSTENDRPDIWSIDTAGERRQVTTGEWPSQAVAVSPDQKYLVTTMARQHDWVLVRMNRDGSGRKVLAPVVSTSDGRVAIAVTPDSKFVLFDSMIDGVPRVWKVPLDGGTPVPVAEGDGPALSPDGSRVAYVQPGAIVVAPLDRPADVTTFEKVVVTTFCTVRWSRDGKGLLHNAGPNDRANVWYQPLDGSDPRKVTQFDSQHVQNFDLTPDGKDLIVARGMSTRDAVLIRNFR